LKTSYSLLYFFAAANDLAESEAESRAGVLNVHSPHLTLRRELSKAVINVPKLLEDLKSGFHCISKR